jgi:membrane protein DedA with SNARE-associated domain
MFGMSATWSTLVASSSPLLSSSGAGWEYAVLFLAVMASWAGVPAIGSAAVAAAAVGASQGELNLIAVVAVATTAGEIGGLIGYHVGNRWGVQILARPGKRQSGRQKLMDKGELAYAKWGRLAVFFTPAIISGTAKMKRSQFAVWNFIASLAFTLSVAATAYGIGRVTSGHHSPEDILVLIVGLGLSGAIVSLLLRRHRRHKLFLTESASTYLEHR